MISFRAARGKLLSDWPLSSRSLISEAIAGRAAVGGGRTEQAGQRRLSRRLWGRRRPWGRSVGQRPLIRRFIDDEARFLWLAAPGPVPQTAVGFDFDGAPFSHVGTLVTFEVLVRRFAAGRGDPRQSGTVDPLPDVGGTLRPRRRRG
ncbi:chromate resistance protein [Klebsiella pneumoniae subsp. pneumoniae]|nr:chromate resistance protein [Klebsiella pneumoniae subsp. pneumoniae]